MQIRQAVMADLPSLVNFNQAMALETEQKTLPAETLQAGISTLLNDQTKGFYLVAESAEEIVGSLMITFEWSDWRNATFWWVQSVYIVPKARRTGVYSTLYNHARTLAEAQGNVCGFRLYVEKDNQVAQATYEHLGMAESHYLMYERDESTN